MDYLDLDTELTAEQIVFKKEVRKFSTEVLRPAAIQLDKMNPEDVLKSETYWETLKQMKQAGYHTALIPENYGGLGLSPLEIHILFEELAFGSAGFAVGLGVDMLPATMAALMPDEKLNEEIIQPFVESTDGSFIGCWALTEPNHGSDWIMNLSPIRQEESSFYTEMTAEYKDEHWVINGAKATWISNGPVATHALLFVNIVKDQKIQGKGIAVCPLDLPGVSHGSPLDKLGQRELPQGGLHFDNVEIPSAFMIFDGDLFPTMGGTVLSYANGCMGAMFTGMARAAFEEALKYSKERRQGNKLLYEHQNVQGKLFNMFKQIEASRALSRNVLEYNLQTMPPLTYYSITSKVFCTDVSFNVAHEAVSILGGKGISKENNIEKLLRDARVSLIEDGSNDVLGLTAMGEIIDAYN